MIPFFKKKKNTFLIYSIYLMYCFMYNLNTFFLSLRNHPLLTLSHFSIHSRGVFQVSIRHRSLFMCPCLRNAVSGQRLFLYPKQVFLPQLPVIIASFTPLATLALSMTSLCFKIVLIVLFTTNKSAFSFVYCLRGMKGLSGPKPRHFFCELGWGPNCPRLDTFENRGLAVFVHHEPLTHETQL